MNQTNLTPPWNEKKLKKKILSLQIHQNIITNSKISLRLIQIQTENINPHKIKGYTYTHLRKKKKNIDINIFKLRVIHTGLSMMHFIIDISQILFYNFSKFIFQSITAKL